MCLFFETSQVGCINFTPSRTDGWHDMAFKHIFVSNNIKFYMPYYSQVLKLGLQKNWFFIDFQSSNSKQYYSTEL